MQSTPEICGLVLLAGLLSFLSPCVFPLAPAYLASLTLPDGQRPPSWRSKWLRTLAFTAGMCAPFFLVGLWAGSWLSLFENSLFFAAAGALAAIFGVRQAVRPAACRTAAVPDRRFWKKKPSWSLAGAFSLGLVCSFGWTSCSTPLVGAILGLAAGRGGPAQAALLLGLYGLGAAGPFFLLTLGSHGLSLKFAGLQRFRLLFVRLGGLAMAGAGLWLIWSHRSALTSLWT
jgi:cytochrome c-type biogenesis protein